MRRSTVLLLGLTLAGCGDGTTTFVCFGSDGFCNRVVRVNVAPQADAGPDQTVAAGDRVALDGTGSSDTDGHLAAFSWVQESGPTVTLEAAQTPVAVFDAPAVDAQTSLRFRLLVTDNNGASATDRVDIEVLPRETAALVRALDLLKQIYRPESAMLIEAGMERNAFLGVWLGARVRAAQVGLDAEVDVLLDELRVIGMRNDDADTHALSARSAEARLLFELGQQEVAAFTERRDPAISERAEKQVTLSRRNRRVTPDDWLNGLRAVLPDFGRTGTCTTEQKLQSIDLLSGNLERSPPLRTAAALLLLTLCHPPRAGFAGTGRVPRDNQLLSARLDRTPLYAMGSSVRSPDR